MARTALIVEDEPDANDILAQLVSRRGFQPVQAYTGLDGIDQARTQRPDLLLLDLMLPDVDGFDVCEKLRTARETNLIPIVMATALSDTEHRVHGFRVGANCYVVKPYTSTQIDRAIDQALAWREQMVQGQVEGEITFDISSETNYLMQVNDLLSTLFLLTPLDETEARQLRLALIEMGQNAIEWGNRKQIEKPVRITYRLHPDRVVLTICDQGSGFNPGQLPHAAHGDDPTAHLPVREVLGLREGGFGMLITRAMVDELSYNETGNEVTLVKRFKAKGASPARDDDA